MLHRVLQLPAKRSCLLLGPRQSGKRTFARALLASSKELSFVIDLLREDVELQCSKEPGQLALEVERRIASGCRWVFVYEAQTAPVILGVVHGPIDSHEVRFLMTGSSARKLRRGEDDSGSELPRAYANSYLRVEIRVESIVRNLGAFARFLNVVAAQFGELLEFSAVGRDAILATRMVQEYYQVLEDTQLGLRSELWKASPREWLVAHPKFYLFDTGVTNAINRCLAEPLDPVARGRLFEQFIVLGSHSQLDYAQIDGRL